MSKAAFQSDLKVLDDYIRLIEADLGSRFPMQNQGSEVQNLARQNMATRMHDTIEIDSVASHLVPEFGLGCRRLSLGDEYMRSFAEDNVHFIPSAVTRLTRDGFIDATGKHHHVDVIIRATGYNKSFARMFAIKGRSGMEIRDFMSSFPRSYNGIMTPFFPNFCYLPGPGTPGSHGGIFAIVEWQIRWVRKILKKMQRELIRTIEPKADVATEHYYHQHSLMKRLVFSQPCASWYKNGRVVGPVCAQYPGSRLHWHEFMRKVRYEDLRLGFSSRIAPRTLERGIRKKI
ncbi:hypothetical protein FB567DRAFT_594544 [Paraphoma chrysanthemicola]|uniref:Monooxygenase n=1 Tax=Paraphoma chrysanthemicola TaxID=798071 RepID=A0A8K0QZL8_9PLEO|nr:hypothetical protein FB567DRAFT_594544 [Paraphoma chrysanthemicola]